MKERLYIPKYSIADVPYRKQVALLKNEKGGSSVVAYFRKAKEAEEFKTWLDNLIDSDCRGNGKAWRVGATFLGERNG